MSSNHRAESALARARQAAAGLTPVARSMSAMTKRGVGTTRAGAWLHLVQDRVARTVSSVLSSAAQRIEPGKPRQRRWRKVAGATMLAAGASGVAGAILNRRRQNGTAAGAEADSYLQTTVHNEEVDTETAAAATDESLSSSS